MPDKWIFTFAIALCCVGLLVSSFSAHDTFWEKTGWRNHAGWVGGLIWLAGFGFAVWGWVQ